MLHCLMLTGGSGSPFLCDRTKASSFGQLPSLRTEWAKRTRHPLPRVMRMECACQSASGPVGQSTTRDGRERVSAYKQRLSFAWEVAGRKKQHQEDR